MSKQTELAQLGDAVTVDSSGRVSRGTIPSWRVAISGADLAQTTADTDVTVPFNNSSTDNCFLEGGCTMASGVITVPVAGLYQMATSIRFGSVTGTDYILVRIVKNGALTGASESHSIVDDHGSSYHTITLTDLFKCDAGDELKAVGHVGGDTSWVFDGNTCHFSGHMVG
tara:strand:+ start:228 stop:737 length:510 start_codon:yes stop_codon:yes gene_type:complete